MCPAPGAPSAWRAWSSALERVQPDINAELHFQPFELNPQMAPEGEDVGEHLSKKYGSTAEQQAQIRETIRERGAAAGFSFQQGRPRPHLEHLRCAPPADLGRGRRRAGRTAGAQARADGGPPRPRRKPGRSMRCCWLAAKAAGLDVDRAQQVLAGDEFTDEVREREQFFTGHGIHSVPAVIVNDRHLISGGQPAEAYEQALRQIAAGGSDRPLISWSVRPGAPGPVRQWPRVPRAPAGRGSSSAWPCAGSAAAAARAASGSPSTAW